MRRILVSIALAITTRTGGAAPHQHAVKGTVTSAGHAVAGAKLTISSWVKPGCANPRDVCRDHFQAGPTRQTASDADGHFTFGDVPNETFIRLQVEAAGFVTDSRKIDDRMGEITVEMHER